MTSYFFKQNQKSKNMFFFKFMHPFYPFKKKSKNKKSNKRKGFPSYKCDSYDIMKKLKKKRKDDDQR